MISPYHLCASNFYVISLVVQLPFILIFRILFEMIQSQVKEEQSEFPSEKKLIERQLNSLNKLVRTIRYFFWTQSFIIVYYFIFWLKNHHNKEDSLSCHSLIEEQSLGFMNAFLWLIARSCLTMPASLTALVLFRKSKRHTSAGSQNRLIENYY